MPKNVPPVTENVITVKIGAFPGGQIKPYTFPPGTSYQTGLKKAGLSGNSLDVRVNGVRLSSLEAPMQDNEQILVFSQIRGN